MLRYCDIEKILIKNIDDFLLERLPNMGSTIMVNATTSHEILSDLRNGFRYKNWIIRDANEPYITLIFTGID